MYHGIRLNANVWHKSWLRVFEDKDLSFSLRSCLEIVLGWGPLAWAMGANLPHVGRASKSTRDVLAQNSTTCFQGSP